MKDFTCFLSFIFLLTFFSCGKNDDDGGGNPSGSFQLVSVRIGSVELNPDQTVENVPIDRPVLATFSEAVEQAGLAQNVILKNQNGESVNLTFSLIDSGKTISAQPDQNLEEGQNYSLELTKNIISAQSGASFQGVEYQFITEKIPLVLEEITVNGIDLKQSARITDVPRLFSIKAVFSHPVFLEALDEKLFVSQNGNTVQYELSYGDNEREILISPTEEQPYLSKIKVRILGTLESQNGNPFSEFNAEFYTEIDETPKFPIIDDEELLTLIQAQTFKYFWDFGHPTSGLARERNTSGNTVTSGGSGFGLMAIVVGMERGFITRAEGVERLEKIIGFLQNDSERFHGVWPHWLNGQTGASIPFSQKDDGADLVETSYLVMGLLTVRQYLNPSDNQELMLINAINEMWEAVEWDWHTKGGENVLYWHWSPNFAWEMNHPIGGWNEALITYILAAASPTHSIEKEVYDNGWARNGNMVNGQEFFGIPLPLGSNFGGPLFFEQYTFLGINPTNLSDQYADYWQQCVNHTLINRAHCIENPKNFVAYSDQCWGLTASDNHEGYSAHSPTNDLGVITPTAALSSFPFTPNESMDALHFFYYTIGDRLWGEYGFHDAFNPTEGWVASSFLAIDQGPIVGMIENHRSGLLWDLFMSAPEVQDGLDKLGFEY